MTSLRPVLAVAEAHAHDLARRKVALLFLIGLPLLFYALSAGSSPDHAIETADIASAFSIVGAGIFTALAGRTVDPRLLLIGYQPTQLVAGRLVILAVVAAPILLGTTTLMITLSDPARPGMLLLAALAVGVVGVPLGLVIGLLVPRDLEAVLLLVGFVGVQLSLDPDQRINTALPFGGPRRLVRAAIGEPPSVGAALALTAAYAAGLLAVALVAAHVGTGGRHGANRYAQPSTIAPTAHVDDATVVDA